jgi:hypothetical protein
VIYLEKLGMGEFWELTILLLIDSYEKYPASGEAG